MPLDAMCLRGVVLELQDLAVGSRIEKIQQPARDQVVLTLRGNRKLLLNAGSGQPRLHMTEISRENPAAPPMFCMLLRKHLSGGQITALEQAGLDRVVTLTIRAMDELGVLSEKRLVLECMGRSANLILLDAEGRIIDCLRRVDMEMNQQRQVLPGLFYRLPPAPEKADPLAIGGEDFMRLLAGGGEKQADQWLLDTFFGLSPLVCRELAFQGCGGTDARLSFLDEAGRQALADAFFHWQDSVKENTFLPFLLERDGKPFDFSYFPILQYGAAAEGQAFDTFSQLLDAFYATRERQERLRQRGHDLLKAASTARDRVARKLAVQEKELAGTKNREQLRRQGELITANLYRMERGQRLLRAEDYYQEGCPTVEIPLDPLLTPQQNAAKYFKQYNKAKTAEAVLQDQIQKGQAELAYLDSILDELSRAELEQDFSDIRAELQAAGYLKNRSAGRREPRRGPSKPREFRSSSGLKILVGRSNSQNDKLTREADRRDIWFHTQKIHGSHVILCTSGAAPDQQSMTEAAVLAAYFSQGREGNRVAVDYTPVKNVKKPAGARPGMVVYDPYQTAYVTPDEALVRALSAEKK